MTLGHPTDNALYYGDCLDWMRQWPNGIVDLIYADPPFNSKQDYNMLFSPEGGGDAQYRAFADTWVWDAAAAERLDRYLGAIALPSHNAISGLYRMLGESGMLAYLTYMAERLEECRRLLKPDGSIYLHCDPTASHYLKAVMDGIFGANNFRNEIIWKRTTAHSLARQHHARVHDTILYYSRGSTYTWNQLYTPYEKSYIQAKYRHIEQGTGRRYRLDNTTAKGNTPYEVLGVKRPYRFSPENMNRLIEEGRIIQTKPGTVPQYVRYLDEMPGVLSQDVWLDVRPLNSQAKERLGYPTQKPLALLERIIKASSNPGDVVLDPFCGCGTTVAAADATGRRWMGVDIDSHAIEVMLQRLGDRRTPTYGIPFDYRSAKMLATTNAFGFETWAIQRAPGFAPNVRQVGDGGIDGRATLTIKPDDWPTRLAIAQVKGGKKPPVDGLRAFCNVTNKQNAAVGCYITLDPITSPKAKADAYLGPIHVSGIRYDRMNLWSIADHFDQRRPHLPPMNNPYTGKPLAQGALF